MRHRKKKWTLDRKKSSRKALLNELARQIILHGKIRTTEARAKAVKPFVEKILTRSKTNTLVYRRYLDSLFKKEEVRRLIAEIVPKIHEKKSGYLQITKIGLRKGDAAPIVEIEMITSNTSDENKAS